MKSKILSYLGVPENISDLFSQGEKDFIQFTEGMQEIYAAAPDGSKKDALALAIVENNKTIMAFLKSKNLGIYASQNVQVEQNNLPASAQQQPEPKPQPPAPSPEQKPEQPATKSKLKSFKIIWNEGCQDFKGKVFSTWKDAQFAFNIIYNDWKEEGVAETYNKVKVEIIWENGKRILDRIDVGDSDYNPSKETLGEYLKDNVSSYYESNFDVGERKTVMWEDEDVAQPQPVPKPEPAPQPKPKSEPEPDFKIGDKFFYKGERNTVYNIVDILGGYLTLEWTEKDGRTSSLRGEASFSVSAANKNFKSGRWVKIEDKNEFEIGDKFTRSFSDNIVYSITGFNGKYIVIEFVNANGDIVKLEDETTIVDANYYFKTKQWIKVEEKNEFEVGDKFRFTKDEDQYIYTVGNISGEVVKTIYTNKNGEEKVFNYYNSALVNLLNNGLLIKVTENEDVDANEQEPSTEEEPQEEFSKEDLELSIKGLMVMVKMNDEDAKSSVKSLLSFYKSMYGEKEYKSKYGKLKL